MNRNRIIILFVLVASIGVVAWPFLKGSDIAPSSSGDTFANTSTQPLDVTVATTPSPMNEDEERKKVLEQVEAIFNAPIAFFGRVIDQYGEPVPHASVAYSMIDGFLSSSPGRHTTTDEGGNIVITGVRGASLSVTVRKTGYYLISNSEDRSLPTSSATFGYGIGSDSYRRPAPTKENPAVFVLLKMGEPVPLAHVSSRQIDVPPTGQAVTLNLATGRTEQGDIELSSAVGDVSQRPFDWQYQLRVPGGGLVEREGSFDFVAPENGYQPNIVVRMTADTEQWASRLTKEYFAKLENGRFARFSIRFFAGRRNFVVLESYVNPEPGSRNLEFDPNQVVQSR